MRVLKPSGSIFVNLGDKYDAARRPVRHGAADYERRRRRAQRPKAKPTQRTSRTWMPPKSLMLLPERYRIGCVDRLGLIARAVIIWDKAERAARVGDGPGAPVARGLGASDEAAALLLAIDEIREPHATHGAPWGQRPNR
jgi:hypothetical protein